MKLQARIKVGPELKKANEPQSVIVEFVGDKEKQHFEVLFYDLDPYRNGIRKRDIWELTIKRKSEVFEDEKTGKKSYFTYLICSKIKPIVLMQNLESISPKYLYLKQINLILSNNYLIKKLENNPYFC